MSDDAPTAPEAPAAEPVSKKTEIDVSQYTVGQQCKGTVVSSKQFGIFAEIEGTKNTVLLPKSLLTRGTYSKLSDAASKKSTDLINFEIHNVNTENKTLSAKYIPEGGLLDFSAIKEEDLKSKEFTATVVGTHDFGIFVELDQYLTDALIPISLLPQGQSPQNFAVGQAVSVTVNEFGEGGKKMTCLLAGASAVAGSSTGGSLEGSGFEKNKWVQGVVTSVASYGMFVRPAGHDVTGLVHFSQIPKDLLAALKLRAPMDKTANKTAVEQLFSEGDVVSVRVNSYGGPKKIDMSMIPPKQEDDEDDYVVDGRDEEPEEGQQQGKQRRPNRFADMSNEDSVAISSFDGQKKLLWWKGEPYVPIYNDGSQNVDAETSIITESDKIVEGTWRRMFELDMREDAADFSSKVNDQEAKELSEDIGELMGMDEDMFEDSAVTLMTASGNKAGLNFDLGNLPDEWKAEIDFFKETETTSSSRSTLFKSGKSNEQQEFDAIIREIESDIARNPKADAVEETPAPAEESVEAGAE